ncbi:hypothetical protein [Streptomyces geranii]|uniref:hypothetical protein n=1 Tax=Streptomyces geranii TaxID=2058923 RepID=UPI000D04391B|nr:hypothetical protein [Streptomyces geranii]
MTGDGRSLRAVWLAVIWLAGAVAAVAAFTLFQAVGSDLPTALGAGGAAFLGLGTLGLAAHRFLAD